MNHVKQRSQLTALLLSAAISLTLLAGCASPQVTFATNEKATITLISIDKPTDTGEVIGDSPQTLDVDRLEGKMVKIGGAGIIPQYWVMRGLDGDKTKITLKLDKVPKPPDDKKDPKDNGPPNNKKQPGGGDDDDTKKSKVVSDNLKYRLLMKAYTALSGHQFDMARGFADQLAKLDTRAAAPHVVDGIAFMQEGNKGAAKSALEKARALDPEDLEITKLIDMVR